jgi:hypothetical protein
MLLLVTSIHLNKIARESLARQKWLERKVALKSSHNLLVFMVLDCKLII